MRNTLAWLVLWAATSFGESRFSPGDMDSHLAVACPGNPHLITFAFFVSPIVGIVGLVWKIRKLRQRDRARKAEGLDTRSTLIRQIVCVCLIGILCLIQIRMLVFIRDAREIASKANALGRLCQMKNALIAYEDHHASLPPLCLRDGQGVPLHSWRALILPHLRSHLASQLDLTQPWNSDHNRRVIESVPYRDWTWFAWNDAQPGRPVTHILAYVGRDSVWDDKTGLPKGKLADLPDAILLVSVRKSSQGVLQPGDMTEEEVRERIKRGEDVLFIAGGEQSSYGFVTLDRGELVFSAGGRIVARRAEADLPVIPGR